MPEETAGDGALRARLAALEEENARLGRELAAAREGAARFRAIVESATDYAILTMDPDLSVTSWNAGAENLLGWSEAEALGMDSRLTFDPADRERGVPEAERDQAAAEGRAGNERWHCRKDGSRFWGSGVLVPLRGVEPGFLKVMRDRTSRREGDERQALLLRELSHRVKNSLAVVLAMARQTGERAANIEVFLDDLESRLLALAAAHDLLSDNGWLGTPPDALVNAALAPLGGAGDGRIRIGVGDLALLPAAAQDLVMVLHELATNALKHGALSGPAGSVALDIRAEGRDLVVAWRESGGPPVVTPAKAGFGLALLEQVATHDGGRVKLDWRPDGLACTLRLPLETVVTRATTA
jgi:PAS domain S-box-containing protein